MTNTLLLFIDTKNHSRWYEMRTAPKEHQLGTQSLVQPGLGVEGALGRVQLVRHDRVEGSDEPEHEQLDVVCGLAVLELCLRQDLEDAWDDATFAIFHEQSRREHAAGHLILAVILDVGVLDSGTAKTSAANRFRRHGVEMLDRLLGRDHFEVSSQTVVLRNFETVAGE